MHWCIACCFPSCFVFSEKNATYPAEARRRPWCSQGPVNGERCAVFQYYKYNYCTINQPNRTVKLWHKNVLVPLRGVSLTDWHDWCIFQSHEISTSRNAFLSICSLGWRLFISAVAEAAPWVGELVVTSCRDSINHLSCNLEVSWPLDSMGQSKVECKDSFGGKTASFSSLLDSKLPHHTAQTAVLRTWKDWASWWKNELNSVEWGVGEDTEFLSMCFQSNICSIKITFLGSQSVSLLSMWVLWDPEIWCWAD